ncbi:MAG TPA: DUF1801 domain-containing protein [Pirellulaceae bacterium]|nr:DUF1801 domain-containing protein [Pirellulaceae bacterium]
MQSKAKTVSQYLKELPADRRQALEAVREVIKRNLDADVEEGMSYGMIGYYIPHRVYPPGYHCDPKQPLPYAGLASQKNHMSIYLCTLYGDPSSQQGNLLKWFQAEWAKTGKKLDMGKSCIRFKKLEDLNLDLIGESIRRLPSHAYIAGYEKSLERMGKGGAASTAKKKAVAKSATKVKKSKSSLKSKTNGKKASTTQRAVSPQRKKSIKRRS